MNESCSNEIEIREITPDVIEYIYTNVLPDYQGTEEEVWDQQTYFQDCLDQLKPMAPLALQKDPLHVEEEIIPVEEIQEVLA
ncbi:MAG: BTB/POZ domain-containing protein [Parachlamydiales bacterium]